MNDRLRWYRAIGGALFGGVTAMVMMALGLVQTLLGTALDQAYGEPIYWALLVIGPIVGFIVGQRPPRRKHEQ